MPRFVYRALEATASDGPTRPLLCGRCEDRFSVWESQFARDIFHPHVRGQARPVKYGPWLLKFATSVCWRVLENARRENQLVQLQERWSAEYADCREVWQNFLRDRRPDVGTHPLHLLGWDGDVTDGAAIAFEASCGDNAAWVHTQMGPLTVVGLIGGKSSHPGSGLCINREGKLKRRIDRKAE